MSLKKDGTDDIDAAHIFLEASARRFEALFDGTPVACLTFDRQGIVYEWNRAAVELWERLPHEAFQRAIDQSIRIVGEKAELWKAIERVFSGESIKGLEWQARFEDGREKWVVASAFPIRNSEGGISGGILAGVDITARKQLQDLVEAQVLKLNQTQVEVEHQRDELAVANAKLEALATTDGLTGLKNHRAFQEFLEHQFQIARRSNGDLSLLLLDVDHFKKVNDRHGHQMGDAVLRRLSDLLREQARKSDLAARYGGEEFVVVLPCTGRSGSIEAADRIRRKIDDAPFECGHITASFGCATLLPGDSSREDLIYRADQALYAAKKSGRNRVFHCDDLPEAA